MNKEVSMRAMVAVILTLLLPALLLPVVGGHAESRKVTAQESKILLRVPYLEDVTPNYQYYGWNDKASTETSYAGLARSNKPAGRAQVYLYQASPTSHWTRGAVLDEKWIKTMIPFLKDKAIQITTPAQSSGPYVRVARFVVEDAKCMAFDLRHVAGVMDWEGEEARQAISGIYCPPAGIDLDDALIQRVFEGIFVRRDGRIERVLAGVNKPIPPELRAPK
jgi:hypothetical protein